jgi:hypothetical protein
VSGENSYEISDFPAFCSANNGEVCYSHAIWFIVSSREPLPIVNLSNASAVQKSAYGKEAFGWMANPSNPSNRRPPRRMDHFICGIRA